MLVLRAQVRDLSPGQLVQVIAGLASIQERLQQSSSEGDATTTPLPPPLMQEGGRLLARAIARQQLPAREIVQVVSAFVQQGLFPRPLFDAACRCFLELPPLEGAADDEACGSCQEASASASSSSSTDAVPSSLINEDGPCITYDVSISDLDPQDLFRLAQAFTSAWVNGAETGPWIFPGRSLFSLVYPHSLDRVPVPHR